MLLETLDYWKAQLGLQSWDIRVKTEPAGERKGNAEGFIRPQIERADLTIFWGDAESDPFELTLLHELVHVRLWAIDPYEAEGALHYCREAAVEWIARALYNEKQQKESRGAALLDIVNFEVRVVDNAELLQDIARKALGQEVL